MYVILGKNTLQCEFNSTLFPQSSLNSLNNIVLDVCSRIKYQQNKKVQKHNKKNFVFIVIISFFITLKFFY